jgi:hypothetical protein
MTMDFDQLQSANNVGYGQQPIPNERDEAITGMLEGYLSAPEDRRQEIRSSLSLSHANTLIAFSVRMASLAVRRLDSSCIRLGVLALLLARAKDTRDRLLVLPLHYRSAVKLEADPATIFRDAAAQTDGDGIEWITMFFLRKERNRQPEVMGYTESSDQDGFRYRNKYDTWR